jgi:hypothetical protein
MSKKLHFFTSRAWQPEGSTQIPIPLDMLMIWLKLVKVNGWRRSTDHPSQAKRKCEFVTERQIMVPFSEMKLLSERPRWTQVMADHLSSMGVPQHEQPDIIGNIFREGELAHPELPINVVIADTILLILGTNTETGDAINHTDTLQPIETNVRQPKFIPATESSIKDLERVKLVDDIIRDTPSCLICLEGLDHLDDDAAAKEEGQPIITRLPCLHHYHGYCIVRWLKIHHMCPVCRYPMPTKEEDEPRPKRIKTL